MARKKYLCREIHNLQGSNFPNFAKSGSVSGMKKKFYGKDALLVQQGSFIYNVSSKPEIYIIAH